MPHTFSNRHPLFHYLCLSFVLLFLSGCAENIDALNSILNADSPYQAQATSDSTSKAGSNTATVDPLQNLTIITHPKSITVYERQPLTLTVNAQSSLPIQYQWYKNTLLIAGANQPTYHVPESLSRDQGFYHVVLKTAQAELRSLTARVTYRKAPVSTVYTQTNVNTINVLKQPSAQNVARGQPFSLSVTAVSASQVSYQWYRNDVPIIGAISPTYTVLNTTSSDQGRYSVLLKDANTSIRSSTALVTMLESSTSAIELTWDTPRMREDGSALKSSDIQAYVIQYGHNFYDLAQTIKVPHQTVNRYVLQGVNAGMLYLRIATMDTAGYRGAFSQTISVWVN